MAGDAFDQAAGQWADAQRGYAKFVARYWADERFRANVQRDPAAALRQAGLEIPEGQRVQIIEVTGDEVVVPIPATPPRWEEVSGFTSCFYCFACLGCGGTINGVCFGTVACFGTAGSFDISCLPCVSEPPAPAPDEGDDKHGDTGALR